MAGTGNNFSAGSSLSGGFDENERPAPLSQRHRDILSAHNFKDNGNTFLTEQDSLANARKRAFPSRLRGEELAQEIRKTYSFFGCELPANLFALHDERAILIQFDVGAGLAKNGFEPPLSKARIKLANQLFSELHKRFEGIVPKLERFVSNKAREVEFEGPFMAAGESTVSLSVRVTRNANYDQVYDRVKNFLETNEHNDNQIASIYKPNEIFDNLKLPVPDVFPYVWKADELDYAENMPPEELLNLTDPEGNIIPPEAFMNGKRNSDNSYPQGSDAWETEAASSAKDALRSWARHR